MNRNSIDVADRIIFEDNHLLVVNKLAGELVQGDKTEDVTLADLCKEYLKKKYDKPGNVYLGIPHRLDRPVSGLVIYTKTSKALSRMSEIFRSKRIEKRYWAIVEKRPTEPIGTLQHSLLKTEKQNKSYVVPDDRKGAKMAVLHYEQIQSSDKYFLIEVKLDTGRHHQIRVQLSHMGCIIKGDLKYGAKRSNADGSIHLHGRSSSFLHPVTKEKLSLVAPCPSDSLWQYFEQNV
ncbi:RluA family pseudouridine synthase [Salibacteraceae bacterium]|nr:RluA family pseudouridine synthase [Salibacteraceae bacterium]